MLKKLNLESKSNKKIQLNDFEFIKNDEGEKSLGIGTFAEVKLARLKRTGKKYALKIVSVFNIYRLMLFRSRLMMNSLLGIKKISGKRY